MACPGDGKLAASSSLQEAPGGWFAKRDEVDVADLEKRVRLQMAGGGRYAG